MAADAQTLHILADASRAFSEAVLDKRVLFDLVARRISEATGDSCTVRLLSADGRLLEPVAAYHADPELRAGIEAVMRESVLPADVGAWKSVLENRTTFRTKTSQEIPPGATDAQIAFIRKYAMRHVMLIPLVARGRVLGGMAIARYVDIPHADLEEVLMRDLADRAALAIDNARLFDSATAELAERRRAEESLRKTEEQLRHSQKMEALGRLAGGVAHDFNNLLSVIISYSETMVADLPAEDPHRADVQEVLRAAQRAASLTRQLLAMSRRQVLEPRVLSLNGVLTSTEKMLRRVLGEDVDLVTRLSPDLRPCLVDPGQMEQVILNMVVNARDAMPAGGKLTLETANVEFDADYASEHFNVQAGHYVMIAISNTGSGMDAATRSRIFEPFFTTKDPGKGTGLGLSTVYGIVKQSGGHIWVYSEPGKGTTFKIYFPPTKEMLDPAKGAQPAGDLRGSETILLVEDEDQLRVVAARILRRKGYNILDVCTPGEAILKSEQHPAPIHLLVTDVVMPGMNGPALAGRLQSLRPEMKLLCMSGYTDEAVLHHGVLDSKIPFLQKPITPDSLARRVREVLDAS